MTANSVSFDRTPTEAPAKVLVVDDDEIWRYVTERYLRAANYDVYSTGDGVTALHLLSTHPIGVLVADIQMPRSINGIALARAAKLTCPDLQVIFVSAYALPPAPDLDAVMLKKPIDSKSLIQAVHDAQTLYAARRRVG